MFWNNKKILVTGAGGFIGSHLVEELVNRKCKVRALVHYNSQNRYGNLETLPKTIKDKIEIVSGDINDGINAKKAVDSCEIIFHLAALISIPYSYHSPFSYVHTNILGTMNIMQACLENKSLKVVHTSTSETYGTAIYTPIDEKHQLQGQSPYSASKIGADKIVESFYRSFGLQVATIRPFNSFGPRQSARAIIPSIIIQILSGKKNIMLGSVNTVRDFTFVKDTVNGFIKIAESEKSVGQVINIGSGAGISIKNLVKKINSIMGSRVKISCDHNRLRPEKSEVMKLICDNRKAKKLVGWKPNVQLSEGLVNTIEYIQKNLSCYKSELYNI